MSGGNYAIYDTATGAILKTFIGSSADAAVNAAPGQAVLAVAIPQESGAKYIDVSGSPVLADRPDFAVTVPELIEPDEDLVISGTIPEGTEITIVAVDSLGDVIGTSGGTKLSGGGGWTENGASVGASEAGYVVYTTLELFPYRTSTYTTGVA